MSFFDELEKSVTNKFLWELITEFGEDSAQDVLNHVIIASLAGKYSNGSELPSAQLEVIRRKFFLQDYFFLVYAYKVPQLFIRESSTNQALNKGTMDSLLSQKDSNPLSSETIDDILPYVKADLKGSRPNPSTRQYILSKLECTFQGDLEFVMSGLPCLHLYAKFFYSKVFAESPYFENKGPLKEWIKFLASRDHLNYFKDACIVCNRLVSEALTSEDKVFETKKKLTDIYKTSWILELEFFQSLLINDI